MPSARTHTCGLVWLLASASSLAGCADRAAGSGQLDSQDLPAPELRCPQVELGALAQVGVAASSVRAGLCGHLVYRVPNSATYLYSPGGVSEEIDADSSSFRFAPTGQLAAWSRADGSAVVLRDLLGGQDTELPRASEHDFVPAPGTEHGADLWGCVDGVLSLLGPASSAVIAEQVDCASVVGSRGSPRVAFSTSDNSVHVADLETLEQWPLDALDYEQVLPALEGTRSHRLWLGYDGIALLHYMEYEHIDPEADASWIDLYASELFAASERVESWISDPPYQSWQAEQRGAPLSLRVAEGLLSLQGVDDVVHAGDFGRLTLARGGRLFMVDNAGPGLLRLSADGSALETLATEVEINELSVAGRGEWAALRLPSEGCLTNQQGECDWTLAELALWHEGEGLRAPRRSMLASELLAQNDAGQLLTFGRAIDPGPAPDPLPDETLYLLDAELEIVASLALDGAFARTVVVLEDQRFLVEMHQGSALEALLLVDPEAATITAISESLGAAHNEVWVSPAVGQLAFVREDAEGERYLYAGRLPE